MTVEQKVEKVDEAFRTLLSETKDSKVVQAITDFIIGGEAKSKAWLHDILTQDS